MAKNRGVKLKLSPARKVLVEMLHHARRVPSVPVARSFNLGEVARARQAMAPPPSWTTVFLRAYGIVCSRFPELRRAYIRWPYPHLYEHPISIAALTVERQFEGEAILLAAKIRAPDQQPLAAIAGHIQRYREAPLEKITAFRQLVRLGKMPGFLRRFAFWHTLHLSGAKRAKRFGTFMLSSYGSLGAEQLHPISLHTTLLTFGPIDAAGDVTVRIIYDHRVLEGRRIALALQSLEEVLHTEIRAELQDMESKTASQEPGRHAAA